MKKLFKITLLLALAASLSSCAYLKALVGLGPQRPKVSIEDVSYVSLNTSHLKLKLRLKVYNPNDFDLKLTNAKYAVQVDDKEFASGNHKKEILAVKKAYSLVTIPISVNLKSTGSILRKSLVTGKKPNAKWNVEALFHGPLGPINVNFEDEKPLY